jgi:hypothetical protein
MKIPSLEAQFMLEYVMVLGGRTHSAVATRLGRHIFV